VGLESNGKRSSGLGEASQGDDFVANEMKAEGARRFALIEMAVHSVADHLVKTVQVVGFREDRLPYLRARAV
jgi:hypothetical protein